LKYKFISVILAFTMAFSIVQFGTVTAFAATNPVGTTFTAKNSDGVEIKYQVLSATTAEVIANSYSGTVNIPATVSDVTDSYTVSSIENNAFSFCTDLKSVTIPNSVTSIGNSEFLDCTSLTNVTIPDSVTYIGDNAFTYCISLASIDVDEGNTSYKSVDGVLFNEIGITLIAYPNAKGSSYTIPDEVILIGDGAFEGCNNLTSVTIPDSVTCIGYYAFDGCKFLTGVTIPDSVTSIGDYAFANCSSLEYVYFDGVQPSIETSAFYGADPSPELCYNKNKYSFTDVTYTFTGCDTKSVSINTSINGTVKPSTYDGIVGETIYLDATPSTGYILKSLTCAYSNGKNIAITGNSFTMPDAAVTVTALFVKVCTVTFDSNGGDTEASPTSAAKTYGVMLTLPTVNPTRSGYTFTDWNTAADGSGITFTSYTELTESITVYAQWTQSKYTVTFDSNGGGTEASPSNAATTYGGTVTLPAANPTRSGYTFTGWNTAADGSGTAVTSSTKVTEIITVYAQWSADNYGVSYSTYVQHIGWQDSVSDGVLNGTTDKSMRLEALKINLTGDIPSKAKITYQAHVQHLGWQQSVSNGAVAGTTGKSLRLEAIRVTLSGLDGYAIKYRVYVQSKGWMDWQTTVNGTEITDAAVAGTIGKALRVEAVEIELVKSSDTNLEP
jgi:uncharacterized repeat protein (TIGR02543 family)